MRTYPGLQVFQHQPDATLSQDNPTAGVRYAVLGTGVAMGVGVGNARIIWMCVKCTWTEAPANLQLYVLIDGVEVMYAFAAPVSDQWYEFEAWYTISPHATLKAVDAEPKPAFHLEGRDVLVMAEVVGGISSNLSARVKWARR